METMLYIIAAITVVVAMVTHIAQLADDNYNLIDTLQMFLVLVLFALFMVGIRIVEDRWENWDTCLSHADREYCDELFYFPGEK